MLFRSFSKSFSYTNTGYTYDHFGRETGYQFTRTYTDGTTRTGQSTTTYNQQASGKTVNINGVEVSVAVTTYESKAAFSDTGESVVEGGGYYGNHGIGVTDVYKSMETTNVTEVSLGSVASELLANAAIRADFTGIKYAEMKDDLKLAVGAVVAVVAVVTTVASFGAAAAFWGAAFAAVGIAASATTIAVAAGVTVAAVAAIGAVQAVKYSGAAIDCAFAGDWKGFGVNLLFTLTSMIGGAQLLKGLGTMATSLAAAGLKEAGKAIFKTAVKRAAYGAAIGGTAATAFVVADHISNDIAWNNDILGDLTKIAAGAGAGALFGALTTNIGGSMSKAGLLTKLAQMEGFSSKVFSFANTIINLGKNTYNYEIGRASCRERV